MRPDSRTQKTPRSIPGATKSRAERPAGLTSLTHLAVSLGLGLAALLPTPARGCPYVEPTAQIAIDLGGGQIAMLRIFVESPEEVAWRTSQAESARMSQDPAPNCAATIDVPLSAFPTSRLASRPADMARSIHETLKALDVRTCEVSVFYENDTNEEIAQHELCLSETFAFGARKYWSLSHETYCWEPEDFEVAGIE